MRLVHRYLMLLSLLMFAACDVIESLPGLPIAPAQPANSIDVVVKGLPSDFHAELTVLGPNGYLRQLVKSELLEDLEEGSYLITAPDVVDGLNVFEAGIKDVSVALQAGGSAVATIVYAPHRSASLQVQDYLNELRAAVGLKPITVNVEGSLSHWLHVRYAVKNNYRGHDEDSSLAWYTPEGRAAAKTSNLAYSAFLAEPQWFIDSWIQAPFHLVSFLRPDVERVSFSIYWEDKLAEVNNEPFFRSAAILGTHINWDVPWAAPVMFPGANQTVTLNRHWGEWPSPLTSCPGYQAPSGLPIVLMLGREADTTVMASSFARGQEALEHCVFDGRTYSNPQADEQQLARSILQGHRAIVLVPRQPLEPNQSYTVSLTRKGEVHTWSFKTAGEFIPLGTFLSEPDSLLRDLAIQGEN